MTASVEDLLARLEPKSAATFEAVTAPRRNDRVEKQPISAGHTHVAAPESRVFVGIPAGVSAALIPLPDMTECYESMSRTLTHFNVALRNQLINDLTVGLIRHCDFRSVPLPGFSSIWEGVESTQSDWRELFGLIGAPADDDPDDDDALLDLAYMESTYVPRPRNLETLKNIPVTVDPNASRATRVYTPEDAEGWVE
ncbi:hypothetical protein [Mycobacterium sp. 852002-40037_SCH5390672]|uniref:hypothetical protein n=1 Tax=Mycobacterium sp. 852002-40037_SCH5390672 TaxID=1834089 RepID=UPI000805E722|nr:hypothetical protein [Mycobacterium sp. 852002-40037_SCH5390672]OBC03022.1 hypothetical protein A5782_00460 [Mycobacterium sp. 852002-40037_SCH5390672]